jgi:ornithine carbamoyltransferase
MDQINLYNRSFITILDFSADEIHYLLKLAHCLKLRRRQGVLGNSLRGKNIALLFEKTSTRTRCAFEIGSVEEGGYPSFIDTTSSQFGKKESVADSARVLASFYHAIQFRGYSQRDIENLAKYAQIPVYNGLTDEDHPTQVLADFMTIQEYLPNKSLSQVKIAYVGDTRNNVANALIYGCAKLGMHFVAYGPKELHPATEVLAKASVYAQLSGAKIEISDDINCLNQADVVYTDVWISMGEEDKIVERANLLKDYKVTPQLLEATANPKVLFMHCLPAFHDRSTKFVQDAWNNYAVDICEVSDEVFHGSNSVVFTQSENRLHSIKAILVATLADNQSLKEIFNDR